MKVFYREKYQRKIKTATLKELIKKYNFTYEFLESDLIIYHAVALLNQNNKLVHMCIEEKNIPSLY
jgi:hypothetical protein